MKNFTETTITKQKEQIPENFDLYMSAAQLV